MKARPRTAASKKRIIKVKKDRRLLAKFGKKALTTLLQRGQASA